MENGLEVMKPLAPTRNDSCPLVASAVMITTSISGFIFLISFRVSIPDNPGIFKSRVTREMSCFWTRLIASCPLETV